MMTCAQFFSSRPLDGERQRFMVSLFVFGTLWFWVLLAVAVIGIGAFIANERFGKATISVILFFTLLAFFGDFNILKWLKAHAFEAALYAGAYFVLGTGWAVAKWWFFVRRLRERYDELKADFLRQNRVAGEAIPDHLKQDWKQNMRRHVLEFGLDDNHHDGPSSRRWRATSRARSRAGWSTGRGA
jgi:hypothetical protein